MSYQDRLLAFHAEQIDDVNNYAYFELAYTRQTEWMAWVCSAPAESNPDRLILARGQGRTIETACQNAMESIPKFKRRNQIPA